LLQLGMASGRPIAQVLADARAGKPLAGGEWRLLAFYAWEIDDGAQDVPAAERGPLLRKLAAACPASESAACTRLMLKSIGLINTYAGVLLPGLASVYGVLFIRQATLAIPDEMLDAARLDGASEWRILTLIVLPLLRPVVVTLALFTFLASWSDFLWPLIAITDQRLYTLPVALAAISREHGQDVELMMAGAVVTTLPVLLLFAALQRSYFTGVLGGGVKG